ncbi:hypothetical protein KIPB_000823 [Kipferlia bialata]|uniref:Uncharacterized protein n=1 Tax=Kipferlia bialata TaxID=797122 RepID=A0A391NJ45_9EUKA|nr:hypothetical protein KIPB_000823 [Kipferlia bialata]|eukprot:g823.t1
MPGNPIPPPPEATNRLIWPPVAVPQMGPMALCFEGPYVNLPIAVILVVTGSFLRLFRMSEEPLTTWVGFMDSLLPDTRSHILSTLKTRPDPHHADFQYAVGQIRLKRRDGSKVVSLTQLG